MGSTKKKEKMTKYYFIRLVSEIILEKIIFSRGKKTQILSSRCQKFKFLINTRLFFVFCASYQFP